MNTSLTTSFIADVPVSLGSYDDYVDRIISLASASTSSYVCVMNAHMLVEAHSHRSFKSVIEKADIVTPVRRPLLQTYHYW